MPGRFARVRSLLARWRPALAVVAILAGGWLVWSRLTQPLGAQRVRFVPAAQTCGASGPLRFCINRAVAGSNGDIVFHLHGRRLDETVWNDDTYWTAMVQAEWQRRQIVPPTVVTLSYGPTWLLTPRGRREASGLLDDLMARLPAIEARAGGARRRILLGESMGGLNVLIAGLTHPGRFARVAALCPGVYAVSPFAGAGALRRALQQTGADPRTGLGVWLLARSYVDGPDEWARISPLALAARAGPHTPALYLSNGLYDAYGNFAGTEQLAAVASRRGASVEWRPLYGGHCAIDPVSLAGFLVS